jgi:hypothetical protein
MTGRYSVQELGTDRNGKTPEEKKKKERDSGMGAATPV